VWIYVQLRTVKEPNKNHNIWFRVRFGSVLGKPCVLIRFVLAGFWFLPISTINLVGRNKGWQFHIYAITLVMWSNFIYIFIYIYIYILVYIILRILQWTTEASPLKSVRIECSAFDLYLSEWPVLSLSLFNKIVLNNVEKSL